MLMVKFFAQVEARLIGIYSGGERPKGLCHSSLGQRPRNPWANQWRAEGPFHGAEVRSNQVTVTPLFGEVPQGN